MRGATRRFWQGGGKIAGISMGASGFSGGQGGAISETPKTDPASVVTANLAKDAGKPLDQPAMKAAGVEITFKAPKGEELNTVRLAAYLAIGDSGQDARTTVARASCGSAELAERPPPFCLFIPAPPIRTVLGEVPARPRRIRHNAEGRVAQLTVPPLPSRQLHASEASAPSPPTRCDQRAYDSCRGSVISKLVRTPGAEWQVMVPPWASMARLTMDRPRPVPLISFCEWCFSTR